MKWMIFLKIIVSFSIVLVACKSNKAPDTPVVPVGPDSGYFDNYTFWSSAQDPESDSVAIKFDWGDGKESDWSSFVVSSDTVFMTHFYGEPGIYEIRAKAKDIHNAESEWSESHILYIGTELLWSKEYGGYGDDYGYAIQKTIDNCYIIAGTTYSYGAADIYALKIDTNGTVVWEKTYGGNNDDFGYGVKVTGDGGFVIIGTTRSFGDENGDLYLLKIDPQGEMLWQKIYGGSGADYGYDIAIAADGFVLTGMTASYGAGSGDVWLVKTNHSGDTIWTKTFGGTQTDCGNSIQVCSDNGYIIAGYTFSFGSNGDIYLIKTSINGDTIWTKTYGTNKTDIANMIKPTSDNGYIIVGGNGNVYVLKIDSQGNLVWEKFYGSNYSDNGYAIEQLPDGKYLVVGQIATNGTDVYYLYLDGSGNILKERTYGDYDFECGRSLLVDGEYAVIAGYRNTSLLKYNVYVVKIKL